MKVLVVIPHFLDKYPPARKLLEDQGIELIENVDRGMTQDQWDDTLPEISGIIVGGSGKWDEVVFKKAKELKIIAKTGKGIDNIDCKKAREYGITVTNTGSANANGVSELVIGLILCCLRDIPHVHNNTVKGVFEMTFGRELKNKTLGLIGFGAIGQLVAKKAAAFDANIIAYDPYANEEIASRYGVKLVSYDDVLSKSDILSVHIPPTKETIHMFNEDSFAKMKDGVIFINAARGTLCDEKSLVEALKSGKVSVAGLDVYEKEPAGADNALFALPNVVCTSHIGGSTYEAAISDCSLTASAIVDVLNGRVPENLMN